MKKCPRCDNENVDYANNCTNCGYSFVNQQDNTNNIQATNTSNIQNNEPQVNNQVNIPQNNNYQQYSNTNQNNNYQQTMPPQNQKSKAIGLILNILVVGLGYAYVGKWGEGIVLLVIYLLMWILGFMLLFPFIIALGLWIYSLIKTNNMIDNYNKGLPY